MKFKAVVEYEYPIEHKPPVKAEIILHGDRVITENIKRIEQEPCEDAVSRQEVKEQMIKYGFRAPDMTVTEFVEDELQPATPVSIKEEDKPRKECENCISMFAIQELHKLKYPMSRGNVKSTSHVNANIALDIGISAIYHSECKKCPKYKETEEEERRNG